MDKYIQNILPRLKQYGQKLNKIESFVDKTWVLHNSNGSYQTFRFKRGGKLIISTDGLVDECRWEYHAPDGLQINPSGKKGIMYRHAFFLESLFIMQIEGAIFQPVLFYNEAVIPNGDVVRYLKNIYASKNSLGSIGTEAKYFYTNPYGNGLTVGSQILNDEFEVIDSKKIKVKNQEITIVNGKIVDITYNYELDSESGMLKIKSKNKIVQYTGISVGAEVRYSSSGYLARGMIKLHNNPTTKKIHVKDGIVTKVVGYNQINTILFIIVIIIFIILAVIHYKSNQSTSQQNIITADTSIATNAILDDYSDVKVDSIAKVDTASFTTTNKIYDYSLFEMTESSLQEMDIKDFVQKIFYKLSYINQNNPNELSKYILAAKNINKWPILIYNFQKYLSFEDFLTYEDNLWKRYYRVTNVEYLSGTYYIELQFYPQ